MSNELINILRSNDLNAIIINKLKAHESKIGQLSSEDKEIKLPHYIVDNMSATAHAIADAVIELNKLFVDKNITANSAEDYIRFLCDLLPEYMLSPTYDDLSSLSKEEIETLVVAQTARLSIEDMREGLITYNYLSQKEKILTKEQVATQFKEIDDGTIIDAYKTLLHKQLNIATQPQ